MKTPTWKAQSLDTVQGFDMVLSFDEEWVDAKNYFMVECGWSKEDYSKLSKSYWFSACITAYRNGVECGTAYLGCCVYASLKDVMGKSQEETLGGYAPQMIEEAIEEANSNPDTPPLIHNLNVSEQALLVDILIKQVKETNSLHSANEYKNLICSIKKLTIMNPKTDLTINDCIDQLDTL